MTNETPPKAPDFVEEIARQVGGTITEVGGPLSDGSGFAIMSMPLRPDHWIYNHGGDISSGPPPMPFRMGSKDHISLQVTATDRVILSKQQFADKIRAAGKYAVRASTMCGKEMDFDPDAMLQNLVVGLLGYWTETGLSSDEWENPKVTA